MTSDKTPDLNSLREILHREGCSCVIYSCGRITLCLQKGVRDLFEILEHTPSILRGALIADKVVGKGAAALMAAGGVKEVYADVISRPALTMLQDYDIRTEYRTPTENIINRGGTGICPVESICAEAESAEECIPPIRRFLREMQEKNNTETKTNQRQ